MSVIRFEFKTEDFYGPSDMDNLKAALSESLSDFEDTDVIEGATLSFAPESNSSDAISEETRKEIITEFLSKCSISANLSISEGSIDFVAELD
jgi:hypothetical protein